MNPFGVPLKISSEVLPTTSPRGSLEVFHSISSRISSETLHGFTAGATSEILPEVFFSQIS